MHQPSGHAQPGNYGSQIYPFPYIWKSIKKYMLVLLNSAIQNIWGILSLYMCGRNGLQLNVYLVDDQWWCPEILGPSSGEDEADRGRWRWCDMGRQLPPERRHCQSSELIHRYLAGATALCCSVLQVCHQQWGRWASGANIVTPLHSNKG